MKSRYQFIQSRIRHNIKCAYYKHARTHSLTSKLFIFGSQRSGTNMLSDAFDSHWGCLSFGEDRGLAVGEGLEGDSAYRWRSLSEVEGIFSRYHPELIVAKPLVESQNAIEILNRFSGARALWMFRCPTDVIASSTKLFGVEATLGNLYYLLSAETSSHWFRQRVPSDIRQFVSDYFDIGRPIADLKAIGWIVRNRLSFSQGLPYDQRVKYVRYETLVSRPKQVMTSIYDFLGLTYPGDHLLRHVHQQSVDKGREIHLSEDLRHMCAKLYDEMCGLAFRDP